MTDDLMRHLSQVSGRDLRALAEASPGPPESGWTFETRQDALAARWRAWQLQVKHKARGEFHPSRLPAIDSRVATWAEWQIEYFLKHAVDPSASNDKPALFMYGGLGAGKTSQGINAIIRIGDELARNNLPFRWDIVSHREFAAETRDWTSGHADRAISDYKHVDLLMLDDLGAFNPTTFASDCTSRLIDYRYSNGLVTIYDSNLLFERSDEMVKRQQETGSVFPVLADFLDARDISRIKKSVKINLGKVDHREEQGEVIR